MSTDLIGIITTITLAFAGYIITYIYDNKRLRKEESLKLINQRLEKFYGPLYFLTIAGKTSYETLLHKIGRDMVSMNPSKEDLVKWREWVNIVFMPNNIRQRDIIYNYAYLTLEKQTPQSLVNFVKHVSELEVISSKWKTGNFTENFPMMDYPRDMEKYITDSYLKLKKEQELLINKSRNT